jgi:hypothetical protein
MSRTVRSTSDLRCAGVAGAAALLLLAGCGGGSPEADSATTPAAGQSEEGTATSATTEFCSRAAGIDDRVDSALADLDDDPSLTDAFRQIAEDLRAIEAPAAIASDWDAMVAGLDRMANAFGQVDITDLDSLEALDRAEGDLTSVSDHVDQYLDDECGI